jgi:RNA polymerase sigma-70 factor (ECF subfamily)
MKFFMSAPEYSGHTNRESGAGGPFLSSLAEQSSELVNRIETGDERAEAELVERYGRSIRLILLKRTGSAQLASDLCQDTFVVTLRKLRAGELKNPASLAAFIRQTAVNISIDHFRREKRYIHQSDGIISLQHSHRDHKAREIDNETAREVLEDALERLAMERDREILRRFYLADEDKVAICRDLHLSPTHFDRVLYRAKQRMRELINQQKGLKSMLFGGLFDG